MQYTQLSRRSAGGKIDWEKQYLTFIPVEDAVFSWVQRAQSGHLEYSVNGGQTWVTIANGESTPTVTAGNKVIWRGDLVPSTVSNSQGIGTFSATGLYDAMGNTMSLLYGDNYIGQTTLVGTYTFYNLWYRDAYINRTNNLILPAIKMKSYCYQAMFRECTNLLTAPNLPATTLATRCYANMFTGCSSLTTAPELPATTLTERCYLNLFYACTKIANIKMLATNISALNCLQTWLYGVSSTGTFVKNAAMTTLPTGASGIPSGWTVVDDNS